jgi:glycine/D-amino acid oxidase-like deaminating enzyme
MAPYLMTAGAKRPVGPPKPNPTESYWQMPPSSIAEHGKDTPLPKEVHTVIIGSGITGSAIAWNLLESQASEPAGQETVTKDILMLEARGAVSGATGRNGGHTKAASYRSWGTNIINLGVEEAIKIARLEYNCIREEHAFMREHSLLVDVPGAEGQTTKVRKSIAEIAHARECETVDIFFDQAELDMGIINVHEMRELMPDDLSGASQYQIWGAEEAKDRFLAKGRGYKRVGEQQSYQVDDESECVGAISYPAGTLSAYEFGTSMLKLCLSHPSALFSLSTFTPATSITPSPSTPGSYTVTTPRGRVTASRVIVATNGYTASLLPQFHTRIVPLRGQVTAQRPGAGLPQAGLNQTYSFIYGEGYDYMVSRPGTAPDAGTIVIGGGLMLSDATGLGVVESGNYDDESLNPLVSAYLQDSASRCFGENWGADHGEGRIRKEWTGIMGYSEDGYPYVGRVPKAGDPGAGCEEDVWIAASFQGHGMVMCWSVARALVERMVAAEGGEAAEDNCVTELETWFPRKFWVEEGRFRRY